MTPKEVRSPAGQKLINNLMLGSDDYGAALVYEDVGHDLPASQQRSLKHLLGGGNVPPARHAYAQSSSTSRSVASAMASATRRPHPHRAVEPKDPGRPATAPATSSMLLPPQLPAPFPARGVTGGVSPILEPHLVSRHASAYPGTVTAVLHAISSPAATGVPRDTQRRPGTVPSDVYYHSAISPPRRPSPGSGAGSPAAPASARSRDASPSPSPSLRSSSPSRGFGGGSPGPTEAGTMGSSLSGGGGGLLTMEGLHGAAVVPPALAVALQGLPRRAISQGSITMPRSGAPPSPGGASAGFGGGSDAGAGDGGAFHLPHGIPGAGGGGGSVAGLSHVGGSLGGGGGGGAGFVPYLDRAHGSHAALACAVDAVARRAEAHKALTRQRMLAAHQAAQHQQHMATGGKVTHGPLGHGPAGQNGGIFLFQPRSTDPSELRTDGVIPPAALGLSWDASPGVVAAAAATAAAAVAAAAAKAEGISHHSSFGAGSPSASPLRGNSVHWASGGGAAELLPAAGLYAAAASHASAFRRRDNDYTSPGPWGSSSADRRRVATVPSWIAVPPALVSPIEGEAPGGGGGDATHGSAAAAAGGSPARKNRRSKLHMPVNAEEAVSLAAEAQQAARSHLPPAVRRGYSGKLAAQTVADWETIVEPNRRMMQEVENVTNLVRGPPSRQRGSRERGSRGSRGRRQLQSPPQSPAGVLGSAGVGGSGAASSREGTSQGYGGHTSGRSKRRYIRYSADVFPELGLPSKPGTAVSGGRDSGGVGGGSGSAEGAQAASSAGAARGRHSGASSSHAAGASPHAAHAGGPSFMHVEREREEEVLAGVVGLPFESSAGSQGAEPWGGEGAPAPGPGGAEGERSRAASGAVPRGGPLGWGIRHPGTAPVGRASLAQPLHPLPTPSAAIAAVLASGGAAAAAAATLPQWVDTLAPASAPAAATPPRGSLHHGAASASASAPAGGGAGAPEASGSVGSLPALPGAGRSGSASSLQLPSSPSLGSLGARGVGLQGHPTGPPSCEPSFGPQAPSWPGGDGSVGGDVPHHHHLAPRDGRVHLDGELYQEHSFGSAVLPAASASGAPAPGSPAARRRSGEPAGAVAAAAAGMGGPRRESTPSMEHSLSLLPSMGSLGGEGGGGGRGASSRGGSSSGALGLAGEASEGVGSVRSAGRPGSARPGAARQPGARPLSASGRRGGDGGGGSRPGSAGGASAGDDDGTAVAADGEGEGEGEGRGVSHTPSREGLSPRRQGDALAAQRPARPQSALPGRLSRTSSSLRSNGRSASASAGGVSREASSAASAAGGPLVPEESSARARHAAHEAAPDVASTPIAAGDYAAASAGDAASTAAVSSLRFSPSPSHDGATAAAPSQGDGPPDQSPAHLEDQDQTPAAAAAAAAAAAPQNPVLTPGAGYRVVTSVAAAALGSADPREAARLARQLEVEEQLQRSAEHETKLKAASRASRALARATTQRGTAQLPPLQPAGPPPAAPPTGYSLLKVIQPQRAPRAPDASTHAPTHGSLAVLAAPVPQPAEMEAMSAAARALLAPQPAATASRTSPQHHGPPGRHAAPPPGPSPPRRASQAASSHSAQPTQDGAGEPGAHPARRASTPPSTTLGRGSYLVVQAATNSGRTAQMQDVWAA